MRIGKRTRNEAALICATAASTPGMNNYDVAKARGHSTRIRAAWLARRAISHASLWHRKVIGWDTGTRNAAMYALAESLIRTGWEP